MRSWERGESVREGRERRRRKKKWEGQKKESREGRDRRRRWGRSR